MVRGDFYLIFILCAIFYLFFYYSSYLVPIQQRRMSAVFVFDLATNNYL